MSCSAAVTMSPGAQSVYSSPGANRTWHVSVQNLDTYTDGALQFQIRASCATAPQCPSPTVSLSGNNVGQPQLCSGREMKPKPHLGSLCAAEPGKQLPCHLACFPCGGKRSLAPSEECLLHVMLRLREHTHSRHTRNLDDTHCARLGAFQELGSARAPRASASAIQDMGV